MTILDRFSKVLCCLISTCTFLQLFESHLHSTEVLLRYSSALVQGATNVFWYECLQSCVDWLCFSTCLIVFFISFDWISPSVGCTLWHYLCIRNETEFLMAGFEKKKGRNALVLKLTTLRFHFEVDHLKVPSNVDYTSLFIFLFFQDESSSGHRVRSIPCHKSDQNLTVLSLLSVAFFLE